MKYYMLYCIWFTTLMGLLQVRASERAVSLSPCLHKPVLRCIPENIMRFSSVTPPGISTLCFLCSIYCPANVSRRGVVGLSLVKDVVSELLG